MFFLEILDPNISFCPSKFLVFVEDHQDTEVFQELTMGKNWLVVASFIRSVWYMVTFYRVTIFREAI